MLHIKIEEIDLPETSVEKELGPDSDCLRSEASKQRLKTALDYTLHLLAEDGLISSESSVAITDEHIQIASKIRDKIVEIISEHNATRNAHPCDEKLVWSEEVDVDGASHEESAAQEESAAHAEAGNVILSDDDYEPDEKKMKEDRDYIPLDYKRMVVNLAKAHPKWKLKSLQTKGAYRLKHMRDLKVWEEHVKQGGNRKDKCNTIDTWTYDRYVEARNCNQQVTTKDLQQWALSAASQFPNLEFKASKSWLKDFKQRHKIRQREFPEFVSEGEPSTIEETLAAAEDFRIQAQALIRNYDKDFVINSDQIDCQYQSACNRSLDHRGSKVNRVKRNDTSTVSRSYTAQYAISLSGKLLPTV